MPVLRRAPRQVLEHLQGRDHVGDQLIGSDHQLAQLERLAHPRLHLPIERQHGVSAVELAALPVEVHFGMIETAEAVEVAAIERVHIVPKPV